MKRSSIIICILLALASFSSCKSQYDRMLESSDVDAKFKAAFDYFNSGKYTKAASLFESLSLLTTGTDKADTVQFYRGLSNYSNKDYYTAETNFSQFLSNYPSSPFSETAQFLHIDCLYRATYRYELDQAPTYKAMTAISEYILSHPSGANTDICRHMLDDLNERLDKKAFENARLYYKMEDYKASRVAFKNILKDDPDNRYREDVLYYTAMSSYKYAELSVPAKQKERYLVFIDDYYNVIEEFPQSPNRKELDALYNKVKEKN
jgi:outer membrane protein assembly factor BamD